MDAAELSLSDRNPVVPDNPLTKNIFTKLRCVFEKQRAFTINMCRSYTRREACLSRSATSSASVRTDSFYRSNPRVRRRCTTDPIGTVPRQQPGRAGSTRVRCPRGLVDVVVPPPAAGFCLPSSARAGRRPAPVLRRCG